MVPYSDKKAKNIGKEIAVAKNREFPKMSFLTKRLYPKMMIPFLNVQHEFDKGFYTSEKCVGCEICRKVCPCDNITFSDNRPVWNHNCISCNACVAYCPTQAIQFQTPEAYVKLNNAISRKIGLPEKRTRYHNPYITAADLMKDEEEV
jgi:ferredoxin